MQLDLFAQLGGRDEERERMVVRLGEQRDATGPVQRPQSVDDVGGGEASLLEKRSGDRKAESELGKLVEGAMKPVEGRSVRSLGDSPEDREVSVNVKVGPAGTEVEEPESSETPGLVEMEIENDLQGRPPLARIASK